MSSQLVSAAAAVPPRAASPPSPSPSPSGIHGKQGAKHKQEPVLHHLLEATTFEQRIYRLREGKNMWRRLKANIEDRVAVGVHMYTYRGRFQQSVPLCRPASDSPALCRCTHSTDVRRRMWNFTFETAAHTFLNVNASPPPGLTTSRSASVQVGLISSR